MEKKKSQSNILLNRNTLYLHQQKLDSKRQLCLQKFKKKMSKLFTSHINLIQTDFTIPVVGGRGVES